MSDLKAQNFLAAINQVCDEKKIDRAIVIDAVKEALKAAYRKDFGNRDQNLEILLDEETGRATVLLVKTVVETVENRQAELSVEEAKQINPKAKAGVKFKIDVTPIDFGRIASQSAKQVIIQKIQGAEREAIYEEYSGREDELLNSIVHRVDGRFVHLELDRTTVILEPRDQIPRERYQQGQRLKVYLEKVEMTTRGPNIKVSRTHPRFVFRLMELEIPEVRNGTVVVKAIARDPGVRCKLVVDSTEEGVDPVGACVGQRGVRIQNITDEINGERIDVIQWTEDFDELLRETLSPAKLDFVKKYPEDKRVEVFVAEDQRALAIGKNGQNVRLAGDILGWEIDVLNTAEMEGEVEVTAEEVAEMAEAVKEVAEDVAEIEAEKIVAAEAKEAAEEVIEEKTEEIAEAVEEIEEIEEAEEELEEAKEVEEEKIEEAAEEIAEAEAVEEAIDEAEKKAK